ncbi:5-methyltetrahydropteroyltriglutamate--homocysteine S-methyltransferase [Paenibacillus barengoltzii]|uniref:5-methyltetrahydropteroyltriglutamate--homocysteine methyltransferase n=2 Tax=Paenibacillus barengoltzii TaxID=343517 RepID=R9LDL8_9BACL|nr:5-methyltetrahydropteroyltriglutamate--homocysteine S-methyltransferase [Paenibacillus barengoltzii]EOS56874.1 5-methyltetrahydropteroyltriglutamate-homocysteine S-methyltransferase [Paenibacillus barengoltzii G22]SMF58806.1 methionine synthase (B12-independent) [Paenibacillus barengoltzii J12]
MGNFLSGNLGYPRIGGQRDWKKQIEAYWSGKITEPELHARLKEIRLNNLRVQRDRGLDIIPVGDFTYYDHVLDTATMFGLVPERFAWNGEQISLDLYYAIARGNDEATASEMTKWFNTNYHYIVPELGNRDPKLTVNRPLQAYLEAKQELGINGRPVLLGLFTLLKLSKGETAGEAETWTQKLLPLYVQVLRELEAAGADWVQIDEPAVVVSLSEEDVLQLRLIYKTITQEVPGLRLMLQTYFDAVERYDELIELPVHGLGLDFVHGREGNLESLRRSGFPADKTLGAGLIDGRNIWRTDLDEALNLLKVISLQAGASEVIVQPSCSLLHVPVSVTREERLHPVLHDALAFAEQKLEELVSLCKAAHGEGAEPVQFTENRRALAALAADPARNLPFVREEAAQAAAAPAERASDFAERRRKQQAKWQLPFLPTTTIGSFPQTAEVRAARQKWRKGEWSAEKYEAFIQAEIRRWVEFQEEIGLDVLVHGEFERTDMVEFFGEKLPGFAFTQGGWVQSYGTRCVKPPIIYGDVEFAGPMTVKETAYAQSLTNKPVKGMLTGPITILNWSFVRSDLSREQVAYQIALALRKEVEVLEEAGIEMIQVDEPALREGLPLKQKDWSNYLNWAVKAFRMTTSSVRDTTQIHTHMCYCEFDDILEEIRALDADVISIETSRSHGELIHSFEKHTYPLGIGLGVYDIHSPRVPSAEEMIRLIERAIQVLDPELFWVNPDCGLKTRGQQETVAALKQMTAAAEQVRSKFRRGIQAETEVDKV